MILGRFLLGKVRNFKFCMVPNFAPWLTDFRTVFVFTLGPSLPIRPVHKNLFWNFQKCRAVLCYILIQGGFFDCSALKMTKYKEKL